MGLFQARLQGRQPLLAFTDLADQDAILTKITRRVQKYGKRQVQPIAAAIEAPKEPASPRYDLITKEPLAPAIVVSQ